MAHIFGDLCSLHIRRVRIIHLLPKPFLFLVIQIQRLYSRVFRTQLLQPPLRLSHRPLEAVLLSHLPEGGNSLCRYVDSCDVNYRWLFRVFGGPVICKRFGGFYALIRRMLIWLLCDACCVLIIVGMPKINIRDM